MKKLKRLSERCLALFTALVMCMSLVQATAFAGENTAGYTPGTLCEHHTEHTADCGYHEAKDAVPCGHVQHDAACGYIKAVEGSPCTCGATADENGIVTHTEGCGYVAAVEGVPCGHVHDAACGYAEAVEASPCRFDCQVCRAAAEQPVNACTKAEDCTAEKHEEGCPKLLPLKCICETKCGEDSVNAECPVCGAENADLTACKGEEVPAEVPAQVQEFLDAVAALPALEDIPEEATEAEYEELRVLVEACQDAYDALTYEDMEREDVTAAIETLGAVIDAFYGIRVLDENGVVSVSSFEELRAAIAAAEGPTTIKLTQGIVTEGVITIASGKDITLTADEGAALTRGDAAHYINVANGGNLVLDNITLDGDARYSSSANAMLSVAAGGSATVQNTVMQYCWTQKSNQGSAVHSLGTLVMNDVTIRYYYSSNGGGIYLAGGSASLTGVTITSQYKNGAGKYALYAANMSGGLTMTECTISGTKLSQDAVAIKPTEEDNTRLENCTITGNTITGDSALHLFVNYDNNGEATGGKVTLTGCTISGNTVKNHALYAVNPGGVVLENTVIKDNICSRTSGNIVGGVRADRNIEFISGAIYGNNGFDLWTVNDGSGYYPATTYSLIKASEMVDGSADFSNYVWSKDSVEEVTTALSGSGELRLKAQEGSAEIFEATIGETPYKTLAEAMSAAESGDTIVLNAYSEDASGTKQPLDKYQYKISEPFTIDKEITIDLNLHEISYSGTASNNPLFNVVGGGSLSLVNPEGSTTNPAQLCGTITIKDGGALTMEDVIAGSTSVPMVVDVQSGAFTVNGWLHSLSNFGGPLRVKLAEGQYITAGEGFSIGAVILDLADAFYEAKEPPVLIEGYTGNVGSSTVYIASQREGYAVAVDKTAGNTVLKKLVVDNSGVYLDPVKGSDVSDGTTPETSVATLRKAMELAADSKLIYVLSPIEISSDLDGQGVTLKRYHTNRDFLLEPTADLTLTNITLDGSASDFEVDNGKSLIDVKGVTVTLDSGVTLKNNDVSNQRATNLNYGGGVLVEEEGHLVMNDGAVIEDCTADHGGGVAIINRNAKMTMNGGVIQNNSAFEGGGIAQPLAGADGTQTAQSTELFIYGGTIDGNTAVGSGGGIFVQSTNTAQIGSKDLKDSKVYITNNSAGNYGAAEFGGGGIYVNGGKAGYQNGSLQLYRAVVKENSAEIGGGGFAGCPTSDTVIGLTNGGAFYDNSNADVITDWFATSPPMPGDTNFPPAWISPVMLGGNPYNWQHKDGSEVYWNELFKTGEYIRFSSNPTEDAKAAAWNEANVFITGNTSGTRGGGIGSNGDVTIGTVPTELGNLTIKNAFSENSDPKAEPENKEYIFTVTGPDGSTGKIKITATGDVTLTDLPAGDYTVTLDESSAQIRGYEWGVEISNDGTASGTYGRTLMVPANGTAEVTFTHTYTPKPATTYRVVHEYYTNGVRDGVVEIPATDGYVDDIVNAIDIERVPTHNGIRYTFTSADKDSITLVEDANLNVITLRYDRTTPPVYRYRIDHVYYTNGTQDGGTVIGAERRTQEFPSESLATEDDRVLTNGGNTYSYTNIISSEFVGNVYVITLRYDRTTTPTPGPDPDPTPVIPPVTPPVTPTPIPDNPTPLAPGTDGTTIPDQDVPLAAPGLNSVDHYAYIIGYPDGLVHPEANVTRAEVATIFFRLMTDEFRTEHWSTENTFSDVAVQEWFNNSVSTSAKAGIVKGYEDGTFRPNRNITRAEFAAIAARFLSDEVNITNSFSDISGHWAEDSINRAVMAGWIKGYPDGTFRPDQPITRAEAVTLINRMLDRTPDKDHLLEDMIRWDDNTEDKWYYADMQEATNSHDYERMEGDLIEDWTELLENRDWEKFHKEWSTAASALGEEVADNLDLSKIGENGSAQDAETAETANT